MAINNFKPFALDPNANVTSQADWEALPALLSGFTAGKASSAQVNKAIRQASFIAAALAQYTANKSGLDVLDDGDLNGFISKMGTAFGKDFQALDATLSALAGLATGANKLPYFTGNDTAAQTDLTSVGRDIIGKNTIADILTYLGLGEAAKRDVGTGENQIPDMVSFSGVRDFYGKQLLPGGLILQWLTIPSSAAVKAVTLDNGNYQLSGYKWPQSFGVLFAVFATKVSGSTNEAYAISVNRHSTDVIVTWNARKADDVHILGIGKL
ncbi:phage tail protein [Escherichia coli]|nr:phage tail protein [Escherichia coli]HAM6308957.1 phage tail protein [Escherichia coli]